MDTNKDKGELSAEELVPNSLAYDLAKSKQTKNLLGSIRKETRATLRVLKSWKIEDISKLQLKLEKDSERFGKLKEKISTGKKKRKPTEDRGPEERKPEEKKPQDKKPQDKKPEEKKPQERKPSPESEAKRNSDFERERAARTRQLTDKGVPLREARRQAYEDTVKAQKYKPEITAEPPKPKPTGGFKLPELPKLNIPKPDFKLNPEQLSRQAGLNKLVGRIFDVKDVADLGGSIAKKDVGGALTSAAGLLANIPKLSKLAYAPAAEKLTRGDVTGAGLDVLFTKASGRVISGATNILSRAPGLANVAKAGPYAAAIGGGLLLGNELVNWRKSEDKKQKEKIQKQVEILEKSQRGENKIVEQTQLKQGPRNWWESIFPPRMAEGGVVTQPTLAIIGEGGEKEYIVPESKLSEFIAAQSQNNDAVRKPARMILGVVDNFISQFGSSSGDIRRMVGGDLLRLERIYGKDRFVLPVFTRGEGSFDNIIGDSFKKLIGTGGGGISDQLYDAISNLLVSIDSFMGMASESSSISISTTDGGMLPGDAPPEVKAMLEAISGGEGSWDSVNPNTSVPGLSNMTIAQARQAAMAKGYSLRGSGAMGKWQQMPEFVLDRARSAGLNPDVDKFSPENQTKIARMLMASVYPGGEQQLVLDARVNPLNAASKLRGTWPSLPGGSQENTDENTFLSRFNSNIQKYSSQTTSASQQQAPPTPTPSPATPSSGLQKVQSEKRPKNGEFVFEPTPGFSKYKIKVSNGRIVSAIDMGNNYSTAPSLIQPYWNEGVGNLYTTSSIRQTTTTTTTTSQPPQTSQRATSITGLIMPTRGTIGDRLGAGRNHKGVDISGPVGTPVVAPEAGEVVYAKFNDGGYGNIVIIKTPRGYHHLAHLNRILTTEGASVSANQVIGEMGSTGRSTGPHLHWELRGGIMSGSVTDPLTLNPVNADGSPIPASMAPGISSTSTSISPATRNLYRRTVERAFQRNPQLNRALQRRGWRSLSSPTPLSQGGSVVAIQPVIVQQPTLTSQAPSSSAPAPQSPIASTAYRNWVFPSIA